MRAHSVFVSRMLGALAVALAGAACGARSELLVRGAVTDGAARDAVADAAETALAPCTWEAGAARAVTAVRAGASLLGAARGPGNTVWVSWQESLAEPVEFRETMITSIDAEGARVFEREGLARPRLTTGFIGLPSAQFNRETNEGAELGWDSEHGCAMQRFDAGGARLGAAFDPLQGTDGFPLERCRALRPWRTGWSFLGDEIRAAEGVAMVRRARDGSFVHAAHLFDEAQNGPVLARASLDDGSFLLGWYFIAPTRRPEVRLRRFGEDGAELGAASTLLEPARPVSRLRVTEADGAVLAAWEHPAVGGERPTAAYRFLTRDGAAAGAVFALGASGSEAYRAGLSIAAGTGGGDPVIVYATRGPGSALMLASVRPDGTARATTRIFADAATVSDTAVVALDGALVVLFEAALPPAARQVYALTTRCR